MAIGTFSKAWLLCFCYSTEPCGSWTVIIAGCINATQSCPSKVFGLFLVFGRFEVTGDCPLTHQSSNGVVICNDCFIFSWAKLFVVITMKAWTLLHCCHDVLWYSLLNEALSLGEKNMRNKKKINGTFWLVLFCANHATMNLGFSAWLAYEVARVFCVIYKALLECSGWLLWHC